MKLNSRQLDTLLAALRRWGTRNIPSETQGLDDLHRADEQLAREHGPALDTEEIDTLCELLTFEEPAAVCRYLDASTAHMKKGDAVKLKIRAIICDPRGEYGWWVHVSDDPADEISLKVAGMSAEFIGVITYARAHGCNWVLFDRDADHIPGLPVFNW